VWNVGDLFPDRKGSGGKAGIKAPKRIKVDEDSNKRNLRKSSYDGEDSPVESDYREPKRVNVKEQY
jgi:hypothetical protein